VTFVVSDGDNVQWNLGGFSDYYNHPARGKFNMGWALSPSLADLAPSVLQWFYSSASNSPGRDCFVAGPSGAGYFYPSQYPAAELNRQVQNLNDLMSRSDMSILQILDFDSFNRMDLWNKYLAQPGLEALFYLDYSRYNGAHGNVLFASNGKPVIGARDLLWSGLEEEASLVNNLKTYPRDPSSSDGYTLVSVHAWSKTLGNIQQVVTNLPSHVRVVAPDAFARLIRDQVGRKLAFDFSITAQGWKGGNNGGAFDKAEWTGGNGNPGGALMLDGSDLGQLNTNPNSWFSRQISLPINATTLRFETMANNDGRLRVRLERSDGTSITLLDWEGLASHNVWVVRTVNLASYAGQTVTLYFEQNDGGQGSGEYRYVDNISILSTGAANYLPGAPKWLSTQAGNAVSLTWRGNDDKESGFSLERSAESNGLWVVVGNLTNATNYIDREVDSGATYYYRLRSWNGAGYSPYSLVRAVSLPDRPRINSALTPAGYQLSWPAWASNFNLYTASGPLAMSTWLRATNPATTTNDVFTITLPALAPDGYFQLSNP
jgi:hypothetical protein